MRDDERIIDAEFKVVRRPRGELLDRLAYLASHAAMWGLMALGVWKLKELVFAL